jgi:A/G-specific adenine glycosylase
LIDITNPGLHNQAIMEFGAIQCVPVNPNCDGCPLKQNCVAYKQDIVRQIPLKIKNVAIKNRYFYYIIVNFKGHIYINKRNKKDIWEGLYEFPLIETTKSKNTKELIASKEWELLFHNNTINILGESKLYIHKLTHRTIHCVFIKVNMDKPFSNANGFLKIKQEKIHEFPVSRLIERYIEENGL